MLTHISRLAFGRAIPAGGSVSDDDWAAFEADTLAASFPDGFTVLTGHGGWRDAATGQTIREGSILVEVAHDGSAEALRALRMVAATYKTIYRQDAVMMTTVAAQVEFV